MILYIFRSDTLNAFTTKGIPTDFRYGNEDTTIKRIMEEWIIELQYVSRVAGKYEAKDHLFADRHWISIEIRMGPGGPVRFIVLFFLDITYFRFSMKSSERIFFVFFLPIQIRHTTGVHLAVAKSLLLFSFTPISVRILFYVRMIYRMIVEKKPRK